MKKLLYLILLVAMGVFTLGCSKDYLDRDPSDAIPSDELLSTVKGQEIALNGLYRYMYLAGSHDTFGEMAINLALDLRCDDMALHSLGHNWFANDYGIEFSRAETHGRPANIWSYYYQLIFQANQIINSIDTSQGNKHEKAYVKGQALAIRAYGHHRLVQVFQQTFVGHENAPGIPVKLTAELEQLPRAPLTTVYDQIKDDYLEALDLLEEKTENNDQKEDEVVSVPRKHHSHISHAVVAGLLSRVYLVTNEWEKAHEFADLAISSAQEQGHYVMPAQSYLDGFNNVYNPAWVWGLAINGAQTTLYASFFSHIDPFAGGYATLGSMKKISATLYAELTTNDVRYNVFADRDYELDAAGNFVWPTQATRKFLLKNQAWEGDYVLMRMEELYLNRGEASFHMGDEAAARADLKMLMQNRLANYSERILSGDQLIEQILLQRRLELWGEGHRFFDMMRNGEDLQRDKTHDPGMARVMNLRAGDPQWIMQIPQSELDANTAINAQDQNPLK
ncbi:RagB/SusD family nutrient uptake outer membrane protein [Persicobacter psychrovividus]|uniref:Membrane protein n=1 Tax=Persicobacter psychrovividus TaxID=387638 RepID=A0ABM7VLR5_9BACT|nr:membrane protein [Persicobacter psychrovividus]